MGVTMNPNCQAPGEMDVHAETEGDSPKLEAQGTPGAPFPVLGLHTAFPSSAPAITPGRKEAQR